MQYLARIVILGFPLLSTAGLFPLSNFQWPGSPTIFGTLTVRARLDSHPPEVFFVTFGPPHLPQQIRRVGNLGVYRFEYSGRKGEYELTVNANGKVLLRHGFTIDANNQTDTVVNLLLEWKDESN